MKENEEGQVQPLTTQELISYVRLWAYSRTGKDLAMESVIPAVRSLRKGEAIGLWLIFHEAGSDGYCFANVENKLQHDI